MSGLFADSNAAWAALIIVLLPLLIIGTGELEEQLRQRDSKLQEAVGLVRVWVVPLFTVWMLARTLFDVAQENLFIRLLGTALLLACASAGLSALRALPGRDRCRP